MKCSECKKSIDESQATSVQMFGGAWETVCLKCARELKAAGGLGAAMDDVDFGD
jgi:hypothetical protein